MLDATSLPRGYAVRCIIQFVAIFGAISFQEYVSKGITHPGICIQRNHSLTKFGAIFRFKNMYQKESLTRSSTVILSTN